MLPEVGLVGEVKLAGKEGGEFVHCSMCSGLMGGLGGVAGRGLEEARFCCDERDGEVERLVGVLVSVGVAASVALDCGLRAVLLPPGELAVAVLPSDVLCPFSLAAAAFSAFLHFARRFWNHTWTGGEGGNQTKDTQC